MELKELITIKYLQQAMLVMGNFSDNLQTGPPAEISDFLNKFENL